jgi:hypothetical protein
MTGKALGSGQEMRGHSRTEEEIIRKVRRTADGDVGQALMAANRDGVREEAEKGLRDHGQVGRGLEVLQGPCHP